MINITNESRVLQGPWTTLVQGRGLGANTKNFNAAESQGIKRLLHFLDNSSIEKEAYYRFSRSLCELIIDVNNPEILMFQRKDLYPRLRAIITNLKAIESPEQYVMASSILFESFGKLGLDPYVWMNKGMCLVEDALCKLADLPVESQQEAYEALQAYGNLFLGIAHIGQLDKLTNGDTDYVAKAFEVAQRLEGVWYRGRGVAAFLTVLGMIGLDNYVITNNNHLKNLIDFLDEALDDTVRVESKPNEYAFAISLMVNCAILLNKLHYLTYKRDWVNVAVGIMELLPANLKMIFSNYLLSALYNAGMIEPFTADAKQYLLNVFDELTNSKENELDYMAYTYYVDIAYKLNMSDIIPSDLTEKLCENISTSYNFNAGEKPDSLVYRSGFMRVAYGLAAMSQMNQVSTLLEWTEDKGQPLIEGVILNHLENWGDLDNSFTKIAHAFIDLSLAQRGSDTPDSLVDKNCNFDKKKEVPFVTKTEGNTLIHAYFPGMNSRRSYVNLPRDVYEKGGKNVRSIFDKAAEVLSDSSSRLDASRLFFEDNMNFENVVEKWNVIGASMTVYNLALLEHLKTSSPSIVVDSVGGESYGMIAAAIASGALSFEDGLKVANSTLGYMYQCAHTNNFGLWHIVSLSARSIGAPLEELKQAYLGHIDIFRWQTLNNEKEDVHVYIHDCVFKEVERYIQSAFEGAVTLNEFKRPTIEIVHSPKLAAARLDVESYMTKEKILFSDPSMPILLNNNTGVALTKHDVKNAILDMVNMPMFSAQTFHSKGKLIPSHTDAVVEFGFGQKTRSLVFEHGLRQRFFEYFGDHQKLMGVSKGIQRVAKRRPLEKGLSRA